MNIESEWEAPKIDPEDERLIDAYLRVGVSVDDLPHTPEITRLVESLGKEPTDHEKHAAFKRLLRLRKSGVLPHANRSIAS